MEQNLTIINSLLYQIKNRMHKSAVPFFVCLCGPAASGKTTFSKFLLQRSESFFSDYKIGVSLLSTDCYMLNRKERARKNIQGYSPETHDLMKLQSDIEQLNCRRTIKVPIYSHKSGKHTITKNIVSKEIIILEGTYSFYPIVQNQIQALKYYFDIKESLAKELKLITDIKNRGHSYDNAKRLSDALYDSYLTHIHPLRVLSDFFIRVYRNWEYSGPFPNNGATFRGFYGHF